MKTKILKFYGKRSVWMRKRWTKLFEMRKKPSSTNWNETYIMKHLTMRICWYYSIRIQNLTMLKNKSWSFHTHPVNSQRKENTIHSNRLVDFEDVFMSKFQYWFDLHHANMYLLLTFEKVVTAFRWIWSVQISAENRNSIEIWNIDAKTLGSMSLWWSKKVLHLNSANEYLFLLNYSKLYKI